MKSCGRPDIIFCHVLYDDQIFVSDFHSQGNLK